MTTVQTERLAGVIDEIEPLLRKHFDEICAHPDELVLDVNWPHYQMLEQAGMLHITTARDAGRLVGYACCLYLCHPHYQRNVFALNDVVYVDPEYRSRGTGVRVIAHMEQSLADLGVEWLHMHVKCKHNFGPLLEHRGYQLEEFNYTKRLTRTH